MEIPCNFSTFWLESEKSRHVVAVTSKWATISWNLKHYSKAKYKWKPKSRFEVKPHQRLQPLATVTSSGNKSDGCAGAHEQQNLDQQIKKIIRSWLAQVTVQVWPFWQANQVGLIAQNKHFSFPSYHHGNIKNHYSRLLRNKTSFSTIQNWVLNFPFTSVVLPAIEK